MRSAPHPADALVGKVLGDRYRVVQLLAAGGTAHVYLANTVACASDAPFGRASPRARVAVKVLRDEHRDAPELRARFEREALAAARVRHPNVLEILAPPSESDGAPFFATELLVGLDLADTLAFARALGVVRAVRIAASAALGLAAAHATGVIHRDVKPENIFLVHARDGSETVKLLDFGFSFLPGDASVPADALAPPLPASVPALVTVVGTPEYMAPEQARGAAAHPSADLYSLGIVLYEMLAGRVPFTGAYPAIALLHATEPPPPLRQGNAAREIPVEVEAAVMKAIAKEPEGRFPSMHEFRAALLDGLPAAARGP